MNSWNIPDWLEQEVTNRDQNCVYCRVAFGSDGTKKSTATWEHIINDAEIIGRDNIARCCFSCNSSKGNKTLSNWLKSAYCQRHNITKDTVAKVVANALRAQP